MKSNESPGNIHRLLSQPSKPTKRPPGKDKSVSVGVHARSDVTYSISKMNSGQSRGSLMVELQDLTYESSHDPIDAWTSPESMTMNLLVYQLEQPVR